jgi:hypothetical protein
MKIIAEGYDAIMFLQFGKRGWGCPVLEYLWIHIALLLA